MNTMTTISGLPSSVTAGETSTLTALGAVALPTRVGETLDVILPTGITVQNVVEKLQPAVFLGWPRGTKGDSRRWGHLTQADMTPDYLGNLSNGNVGVVFGRKSADAAGAVLAGIDLDRADFVQAFLAANPRLAGTWMSRGRPDRLLVIVRIRGPYPRNAKVTHASETTMGKNGKRQLIDLGEWRVDGSQSVVPPSIHPDTQRPYEVVSFNAPVVVEYNEIVWPPMVGNPPSIDIAIDPVEETHQLTTHLLSNTEFSKDVPDKRSGEALSQSVKSTEALVDYEVLVLPHVVSGRGQSNKALLDMARQVRRLQKKGVEVDARLAFSAWWNKSAPHVDPHKTADEFLLKFLCALENCDGGDVLEQAWHNSAGLAAPGAETLLDARLRRLAAFCYRLDQLGRGKGFYLGCRQLAQLFLLDNERISHVQAWHRLRALQALGVIKMVTRGKVSSDNQGSGKANHYKYIGGR